ncbi:hypothetical protein [Alkalihalobacterium alkalinitrilicum]|nr:hypothetical protein [Alkalihalobacterium alkalinitrilicum]
MIGISYFATVQLLPSAENPPHLKQSLPTEDISTCTSLAIMEGFCG